MSYIGHYASEFCPSDTNILINIRIILSNIGRYMTISLIKWFQTLCWSYLFGGNRWVWNAFVLSWVELLCISLGKHFLAGVLKGIGCTLSLVIRMLFLLLYSHVSTSLSFQESYIHEKWINMPSYVASTSTINFCRNYWGDYLWKKKEISWILVAT